ncbi:MAG TPA: WD40 repeat domain-containing protein, partial [Gemmataceae bacterium]|nr:WD40 repeat domain-containing protein [Gemmataceae bacterium]
MKQLLYLAVLLTPVIPAAAQMRPDDDRLPEGAIARVGSTRFRTDKFLTDLAFSPDGKLIAGASGGRRFTVWEVATGRELFAMRGTDHPAFGRVQFTSDGKYFVVGRRVESPCQEVCCYETRTGRQVFRTGDRAFQVDWGNFWQPLDHQWRIGPNDTLFVQGSVGPGLRELRGFELPRGRETVRSRIPAGATLLDWTPDGTHLLLRAGGRFSLREMKAGKANWELDVGERKDVAGGLTPGGKHIVIRDGSRLRVHDAVTGRTSADVRLPDGTWDPTTGLSIPHDRYGVTNSQSKEGVREYTVIDLDQGRVCLGLPAYAAQTLAISPDGRFLTARAGASTSIWDLTLSSADPVAQLPGATAARFSPDGRILALDGSGCIGLYDVASWRLLPQSASPASSIRNVRFTSDGRGLVGLTGDGWHVWEDWTKPGSRAIYSIADGHRSGISLLSEDAQIVAEVLDAGTVGPKSPAGNELRVTDHRTGKTRTLPVGGWRDRDVCLSGDGRRLFTWRLFSWTQKDQHGGEIRVWDTATGEALSTWQSTRRLHYEASLCASHDGRWLAEFPTPEGAHFGVRLWDVERRREVGQIAGVAGTGNRGNQEACFSRDGRRLAAVVFDRRATTGTEIRVWDWRTGKQLLSVTVADFISVVSLSHDGRAFAVGENDGRLRVFEIATSGERAAFRHGTSVESVAFHPDGSRLAASSTEAPVYIWNLRGDPGKWDAAKSDDLWTALSSADSKVAFAAMQTLRANPAEAIAFLRDRAPLPPAPTDDQLAHLLKQLDAPGFADRERAQKELAEVVEWVRPKLELAQKKTSGEVAQRLERVLKPSESLTPTQLRQIRACEVLEGIGTSDAVKLLRAWAAGPEKARLTIE